jgi:predicted Zn-dependent peptidase
LGMAYVLQRLMLDHAGSAAREPGCALAERGGVCEASTDTHATVYIDQIAADVVELALRVEANRMDGPPMAISQTSLDRLRILIAQQAQQHPPSVLTHAEQRLRAELFPGNHPYRHHLLTAMSCLHAVKPAEVQEFFETFYAPSNAVLAITGGIDPQQVLDRVERYFGAITGRARPRRHRAWDHCRARCIRASMLPTPA